ncbi:putative polyketide synthase [Xylariaceae sp. FL0016]|nr:putative polyketide synthase [Xylariaceae sp. FL0016]
MGSLPQGKFSRFDRKDFVYSTISHHDIWTSVFIPTGPVKHRLGETSSVLVPILVFWHGGGFIVGNRLYEPWWPGWLLDFAVSRNAIVVAPDYRLLPEATGADMVDDLHAFWIWMLEQLPGIAQRESWALRPDFGHILCAGHSAGGTLALLSALERPDADVKAVLSLYGPMDDSVPELKMARPRKILGSWPPPPRQAEATIRSYIQRTRGTVRTDGDPVEMWELVTCILQQGRLPRMMSQRPDPRLDVILAITKRKTLPPIWLIHGENDSIVPLDCSTEFVRRINDIVPDAPLMLSIRPGEHNFDASLGVHEPWIAEGCDFLLKHW